jgi:holo-ACP synthase/triphosphoribosyl-dephospho-CoA synthase
MNENLLEILAAREARAATQKALLEKYRKPLLCFTLNIPGPEKFNRDVSIAFFVGNQLLQDALRGVRVLYRQLDRKSTGCEGYYVVDMPVMELKRLAVEIEEADAVARLFDMDVLDTDGRKISREELGLPRRKCLLCDNDAAVCASTRAHGLDALQERTGFLMYLAARQYMAEFIASRAYTALTQELSTTPKPGLVDRNNRGAHKDMGPREFFASANALRPFFCRMAEAGYLTRDKAPEDTFQAIRPIGIEAEDAMLKATGGVNTHKGAIFSLGILCAATGRLSPENWTPENICAEAAKMTQGIAARELSCLTAETATTAGQRIYAQFGVAGARGEAESGFPSVLQVGLPRLGEGLQKGLSFNDAGAAVLLHLIAAQDDTNLIHRGGRQLQLEIRQMLGELLVNEPYPNEATLLELDSKFIEKNLSPGGSADLLALTYFLYFLCKA